MSDRFSTLAGIVMRSDLVIDGFGIGKLEVSGSDATDVVNYLFKRMRRNDINVVLLSGSILSLYNIIDVDLLFDKIKTPVLALTFKKSKSDLARNINARFEPKVAKSKMQLLEKLGTSQRVKLHTNYSVFLRSAGVTHLESQKILDKFTLQGAIPEPIRVARLLAKAVSAYIKDSSKVVVL
jgi:endonuclease V-like protein UPF0215 family